MSLFASGTEYVDVHIWYIQWIRKRTMRSINWRPKVWLWPCSLLTYVQTKAGSDWLGQPWICLEQFRMVPISRKILRLLFPIQFSPQHPAPSIANAQQWLMAFLKTLQHSLLVCQLFSQFIQIDCIEIPVVKDFMSLWSLSDPISHNTQQHLWDCFWHAVKKY